MSIEYVFACIATLIASFCILGKLVLCGTCKKAFDEGHSPWDADAFIIPPRWPLILAFSSLYFQLQATRTHSAVMWTIFVLFWLYVWFKAIREFHPLSQVDETGHDNEGDRLNEPPVETDG